LGGRVKAFDDQYIISAHIAIIPVLVIWAVLDPILLTMIEWRNNISGDELSLFQRPVVAKEERMVLDRGNKWSPYALFQHPVSDNT
jgi:hypothetical protein